MGNPRPLLGGRPFGGTGADGLTPALGIQVQPIASAVHAASRIDFQLVEAGGVYGASNSAQEIEGFHEGQMSGAVMMQRTYRMSRRGVRAPNASGGRGGNYLERFKSAFAIRGLGAGHERRHEVHVQKEIAVPPVSTCSCFTNAESWHPGQGGAAGWDSVEAEGVRIGHMRARVVRSLPLC